jgi:hypothetical protein
MSRGNPGSGMMWNRATVGVMTRPGPLPSAARPIVSPEGPTKEGNDESETIRVTIDPSIVDDAAVRRVADVLRRIMGDDLDRILGETDGQR